MSEGHTDLLLELRKDVLQLGGSSVDFLQPLLIGREVGQEFLKGLQMNILI